MALYILAFQASQQKYRFMQKCTDAQKRAAQKPCIKTGVVQQQLCFAQHYSLPLRYRYYYQKTHASPHVTVKIDTFRLRIEFSFSFAKFFYIQIEYLKSRLFFSVVILSGSSPSTVSNVHGAS